MMPEDITWLECRACYVMYPMDESDSDEHCATCSDWHAWWSGQRLEETG